MATVACKDETKQTSNTDNTATETVANEVLIPTTIVPQLVNKYPHDTKAFTEGLEYHDGLLYESTGQYGESEVRKVDVKTGEVKQRIKMGESYFGEGMTMMGGKLYQLTYREGKGFIYDPATLRTLGQFTFPSPEGWGLTNNGTQLIYNDGGNVLYYLNPITGQLEKQLPVIDEHGPVKMINELELINGYIYANQWQTDLILKIDTNTGRVVARADMGPIRQMAGIPPASGREDGPDVLNGIAYDAATNRIFVTGKNWPNLFEVRLDN